MAKVVVFFRDCMCCRDSRRAVDNVTVHVFVAAACAAAITSTFCTIAMNTTTSFAAAAVLNIQQDVFLLGRHVTHQCTLMAIPIASAVTSRASHRIICCTVVSICEGM